MKKLLILVTALFSIFTFGCKRVEKNTASSFSPDEFSGIWKTLSLEKEGIQQQIAESEISFEVKDSQTLSVNGNSGVNTFFGDVIIKDGKVTVSDKMASTKMAGSPEAMEFEDLFLSCLTGADDFEIFEKDNESILKISNQKTATSISFVKVQ